MKTLDECIATGMLINMHYDTWTHSFRRMGAGGALLYTGALCAETLEPFPKGDVNRREKDKKDTRQWGNFCAVGRVPGYTPRRKDVDNFHRFKRHALSRFMNAKG